MGMAASQARYLALTARKTNVEYEGQQINQARLFLANQTADLFNQMLGLSVPTAPSSQSFSKLQYVFNDGINSSIIENYYQLGTSDEDYNYVVTSYHYADMYTGSRKLLNDPQVQATKTDKYSYDPTINQKTIGVKAIVTPAQTGNGTYVITDSYNVKHTFKPVDNTNTADRQKVNAIAGQQMAVDEFSYDVDDDTYTHTSIQSTVAEAGVALNTFTNAGTNYTRDGLTYEPVDLSTLEPTSQDYKNLLAIYGDAFEIDASKARSSQTPENTYYKAANGGTTTNYAKNVDGTGGATSTDINTVKNTNTTYTRVNTVDPTQEEALIQVYGKDYDKQDKYYVYNTGTVDAPVYNYISANDIINGQSSAEHKNKTATVANSTGVYYTDGKGNYVLDTVLSKATIGTQLKVQYAKYSPVFTNFTAVGNSKLQEVTEEDYKKDKTISVEIEQIIKDMQGENGNSKSAEYFAKCFNAAGEYIGGIYSFKMNGTTYYTTEADLEYSIKSAYDEDSIADNGIDGQQDKLAYYNATYVSTKVEETRKALLETDGAGRFSTIKFENDSVVYTLSVETITDDAAFEDAMNKYYYDQDVYDKAVTDINAKTEIIQAQDRELELRLEQLNTEQSALQNEMEAVKKIVDKSVEHGFKTFGG